MMFLEEFTKGTQKSQRYGNVSVFNPFLALADRRVERNAVFCPTDMPMG